MQPPRRQERQGGECNRQAAKNAKGKGIQPPRRQERQGGGNATAKTPRTPRGRECKRQAAKNAKGEECNRQDAKNAKGEGNDAGRWPEPYEWARTRLWPCQPLPVRWPVPISPFLLGVLGVLAVVLWGLPLPDELSSWIRFGQGMPEGREIQPPRRQERQGGGMISWEMA